VPPPQSEFELQALNNGSLSQRMQSALDEHEEKSSRQVPVPRLGWSPKRKLPQGSEASLRTLPVVTLLKRTAKPMPEMLADSDGAQSKDTPPKSLVVASTRQVAPGVCPPMQVKLSPISGACSSVPHCGQG
jgi:hypothetical protein